MSQKVKAVRSAWYSPWPKNPRLESTPTYVYQPAFGHGGARGWETGEMETGEMANDMKKKWEMPPKRNGGWMGREMEMDQQKKWDHRNGAREMGKKK